MAREAGIIHPEMVSSTIKAFEALVRADEREVCAYRAGIALLGADRGLANRIDQAIRARGTHDPM
jgi:hypothetical protein